MSFRSCLLGLCASLLVVIAPARGDLTCGYELQRWSTSGIEGGTTSIAPTSGPSPTATFSYDVNLGNPGPGVTFRFTDFSVLAGASGRVTFNYDFSGFHAFCCAGQRGTFLQLVVEGPGSTQTINLVTTETFGDFAFSGQADFNVFAGFRWSLRVGGRNFDSNSRLMGRVIVSNFVAPVPLSNGYRPVDWQTTGIPGGATSIMPLGPNNSDHITFAYDVNLGNPGPGVTFRGANFFVPGETNEQVTFDWTYTGFHGGLSVGRRTVLQTFAYSCNFPQPWVETLVNETPFLPFTYSGRATVLVRRGEFWGISAFGANPTTNSVVNGSIAITNVCRVPNPCTADVDDGTSLGRPDGGVTVDDLLYYILTFSLGIPCADIDDGTGSGRPDGGVTIDDALYFFLRFQLGC